MPIIDYETISIPPDRIRREFPEQEQEKLVESILSKGLLHPLVIRQDGSLLAGERRYRALGLIIQRDLNHRCNGKELRPGLVMVTYVSPMTRVMDLEAELEENDIRLNISWEEKAQAVARIHELRNLQRQEKGLPALPKTQAVKETAAEVFDLPDEEDPKASQLQDVRKDLLVAAWLKVADAEVSSAKDRSDALKIIEKKLMDAHRRALAREFDQSKSSTPHTAINGDLFKVLPTLPKEHFDVICCDPPYGVDADTWQNQAAEQHTYQDTLEHATAIWECIAREGHRVTKPAAHAYVFCDFKRFGDVSRVFERAGWVVWSTPLIWFKGPNVGIAPRPEHGPRRTYECILFASKGDKRVTQLLPDTIVEAHDKTVQRGAHKPAGLYEDILRRSVQPGDRVIDPCAGVCPIFDAATRLRVIATAIEIDERAFGEGIRRLAPVQLEAFDATGRAIEHPLARGRRETTEDIGESELDDWDEPSDDEAEEALSEI